MHNSTVVEIIVGDALGASFLLMLNSTSFIIN